MEECTDEGTPCGTRFRGISQEFTQDLVRLAVLGVVEINSLGFVNVAFDPDGALVTDCKTNVFIKAMRSMFGVEPEYLFSLAEYNFKSRDEAVMEANIRRVLEAMKRFGRSDLCILTYGIPVSGGRTFPDLLYNIQLFLQVFAFPNFDDPFVIHTDASFVKDLERFFDFRDIETGERPKINISANKSRGKSSKSLTRLMMKVKLSYIQKLVPEFNKFTPTPIITISSIDEHLDEFTREDTHTKGKGQPA